MIFSFVALNDRSRSSSQVDQPEYQRPTGECAEVALEDQNVRPSFINHTANKPK